ncbi:MAG: hypothetical protein CMH57_07770 [Myxococcales bacterium]|nr:hypothetical protein [Myxococcales bacterium]
MVLAATGCSFDDPVGCRSDSECRGDRICISGTCQDPNAASSNATSSNATSNATSSNSTTSTTGTTNTSNATTGTTSNGTVDAGGPDTSIEPDVPEDTTSPVDTTEPSDVDPPDTSEPDTAEPDTSEPDTAEPDVPTLGPVVQVSPESIDFGEVGLLVSSFAEVTVRNDGDEPLALERVGLSAEPSQGFQVIAPEDAPRELAAGEEVTYQVRFRPTALRNDEPTEYGNSVVVATNDPENPEIEVPLEGLAVPDPEQCLTFEVNGVDFGFVQVGDVNAETVALVNCGEEALNVSEIGLEGSDAFSLSFGGDLPRGLDPGDRMTVIINYEPATLEGVQAIVTATSDAGDATLVAQGGAECPVAVALARAEEQQPSDDAIEGRVGTEFVFNGFLSNDPSGDGLEYMWTVEAPDGSDDLQIDPGLDVERFTMRPDVPGEYRVSLSVRSETTGLESCNTDTIIASAFELTTAARVTLTWNNEADLDLHIVRANADGDFSDWGRGRDFNPDDIYYGNPSPDFGEPGEADDPRFLGDDTNGEGPETTEFGALEEDRSYRIGVNYARRNGTQTSEAEVMIKVGDADPVTLSATLEEGGVFWIPAILNGDGTVTVVNEFE